MHVVLDVPSLPSCSLLLENDAGGQIAAPCLRSNETANVITNISPHRLRGMWEGLYAGPTAATLPPRPAYIPRNGYAVGVALSEMVATVSRAASE